jgi:leucyl/phenylalanyl-tRNA--protein transferase
MTQLTWLHASSPFPKPESALEEPNGLLAAGRDLNPERILNAYRNGIFPWYSDGQPILWWSPNPRCIIYPEAVHCSSSLNKYIRKTRPRVSFDQAFEAVIRQCARLDTDQGTWITEEMEAAYIQLHYLGYAHSVEVWQDTELVGGLYGLAMGKVFFGESMFSKQTNASKIAFVSLCRQLEKWGYKLIDCQVENPHLLSLGAQCIHRNDFLRQLSEAIDETCIDHKWQFDSNFTDSLPGFR